MIPSPRFSGITIHSDTKKREAKVDYQPGPTANGTGFRNVVDGQDKTDAVGRCLKMHAYAGNDAFLRFSMVNPVNAPRAGKHDDHLYSYARVAWIIRDLIHGPISQSQVAKAIRPFVGKPEGEAWSVTVPFDRPI